MTAEPPSRRELFEQSLAGAANRPPVPHLRDDAPFSKTPIPKTLDDYRSEEGPQARAERIHALWLQLRALQQQTATPNTKIPQLPLLEGTSINSQRASELRKIYIEELCSKCRSHDGPSSSHGIDQKTFQAYVDQKEEELWSIFHDELDLDGNGHLDAEEFCYALGKAGMVFTYLPVVSLTVDVHRHPLVTNRSVQFHGVVVVWPSFSLH
jgi:solute carrier family 25 phosphate transporter 23/24/25/41